MGVGCAMQSADRQSDTARPAQNIGPMRVLTQREMKEN